MLIFFSESMTLILSIVFLTLTSMLLFEVLLAFFHDPKASTLSLSNKDLKGTLAVLVPAHNEELLIKNTLIQIQKQLGPSDRLIVIADNCCDKTVEISKSLGVTVLERNDSEHLGKGYALDYGLKALEKKPTDVVAVIDADCIIEPGSIKALKQQALATGLPAQAINLLCHPVNPNAKDRLSAFAFKVKNLIRPLGLSQLGLPCLLSTGMALPWTVIQSVDLASNNIVEDVKLGLDLATAGYPARLCLQAKLKGVLPGSQSKASTTQRTRWEHGHLQILRYYFLKTLIAAIKQQRLDLLLMISDLAIPPLSLLVILLNIAMIATILVGNLAGYWLPVCIILGAYICLIMSILIAWVKFGKEDLTLKHLLMVPAYLLWKLPIYIIFLFNPQNQWVRTERLE